MIATKLTKLLFAFLVLLLLSGCGYYNPYASHGAKPISLYHSMWPNRTTELGLENVLFQAQSDWLRKSPLITLTDSAANADYELTGNIDQVTYPEISFGAYREGIQGNAKLKVSILLKEKKSDKVIWRQTSTREATFIMSQNPNQLQANRKVALRQIAEDFGEEIYLYLINTIMRPGTQPVTPIKSYSSESHPLEKLP